MEERLKKSLENSISHLVSDFQSNITRTWNERDLHWSLFYNLKREDVVPEKYTTQLIRAEFMTLKKFGDVNPTRGHYDLVILDSKSVEEDVPPSTSWDEWLPKVTWLIAVEIKLWLARLPLGRADWDIQKLTESPNNIRNAYFLNFVQLNFSRKIMKDYYQDLRKYLEGRKHKYPYLNILCVPCDTLIQPVSSKNWL